ncbi:MAG: hypothetical protein ACE15F_22180 [bacterium]
MDKRKLFRDIARIRQQLFALTAFAGFVVVCLATLIGQGPDFYVLFRNSTLAILAFGVLGYVWGILYVRTVESPLLESYRLEAQQRVEELRNLGHQRLTMTVSVSELVPGMKVVDAVFTKEGALLVRQGAVLSERLIQALKENNIPAVKVEAQRSDHEDMDEEETEDLES